MDIIGLQQFIIVFVFLALLGAVWFVVRLNKGELRTRLAQGRRMELAEVTSLGGTDKALLLKIDDREFLVVNSKGAAPVVTDLGQMKAEAAQ